LTQAQNYLGVKGDKGDKGTSGYTGSAGQGYDGSSGRVGYTGSGGIGYSGSGGIGYSGSGGTNGFNGYDGSHGLTGYVGSGATGYVGSIGAGIPIGGLTNQSLVKLSNTNYDTGWATVSSLASRNTINTSTSLLSPGNTGTVTVTGYKSYALLKVNTSAAAWVRIYTDSSSRTSDAGRSDGTDPLPGTGVIAEVITTSSALTQVITPGVIGFNLDAPVSENLYMSVTNMSGVSTAVTVSLTLLKLEN
jgi:hypothetical protein